jgi:hypothetical protein
MQLWFLSIFDWRWEEILDAIFMILCTLALTQKTKHTNIHAATFLLHSDSKNEIGQHHIMKTGKSIKKKDYVNLEIDEVEEEVYAIATIIFAHKCLHYFAPKFTHRRKR